MRNRHVNELRHELARRTLAYEEPDLLEGRRRPREEDQAADEDGAKRVDPPHDGRTDDGHGQAKGVDDNVVAVVQLLQVSLKVEKDHAARRTMNVRTAG